MAWSDDLTPELVQMKQDIADTTPFRQGYLVYFDLATGNNIVEVGGGQLTNLPLLNIGDTVNLVGENTAGLGNGSVIIVAKMNSSWAILGRMIPAGAGQLNSTAIGYGGTNPGLIGTGLTATGAGFVTKVTGTVVVPAWANRASVIATVVLDMKNNGAGANFLYVRLVINGASGAGPFAPLVAAGAYGFVAAHATRNGFVVTPGGSFDIEGQVQVGASFGAGDAANLIQVDSFVIFSKV